MDNETLMKICVVDFDKICVNEQKLYAKILFSGKPWSGRDKPSGRSRGMVDPSHQRLTAVIYAVKYFSILKKKHK